MSRSDVWKFFDKKDNKNAVCNICQKTLKTSGRVPIHSILYNIYYLYIVIFYMTKPTFFLCDVVRYHNYT